MSSSQPTRRAPRTTFQALGLSSEAALTDAMMLTRVCAETGQVSDVYESAAGVNPVSQCASAIPRGQVEHRVYRCSGSQYRSKVLAVNTQASESYRLHRRRVVHD